jgi:hypothetical protein
MRRRSNSSWSSSIGTLASVAAALALAVATAQAQPTRKEFTKVSGREYLDLCARTDNELPCLQAIYANAAVNRLLDAIKNQRTFCPPASNGFPPTDIIARVAAWLRSRPALLEKTADEALSAALVALYPCRKK